MTLVNAKDLSRAYTKNGTYSTNVNETIVQKNSPPKRASVIVSAKVWLRIGLSLRRENDLTRNIEKMIICQRISRMGVRRNDAKRQKATRTRMRTKRSQLPLTILPCHFLG